MRFKSIPFVLILAITALTGCYRQVEDHEAVVVSDTDGPQLEILEPGWSWVMPWEDWYRYNLADQLFIMGSEEGADRGCQTEQSSDGQDITICVKLRYSLDKTKLIFQDSSTGAITGIHKEARDQYERNWIQPEVERAIKDTTVQYTAKELYTNKKTEFNNSIETTLKENPDLGGKGIQVLTFVITDITLSKEYKAVIEATMLQKENLRLAEQKRETALKEAEAAKAAAQTQVEQTRAVAEADKIQKVLAAEAAAEAAVAAARADRTAKEEQAQGDLALGEAQAKVEAAKRDSFYAGVAGQRRMQVEIARANAEAAKGIFTGVHHVGPETVQSVLGSFGLTNK